MRLFIVLMIIVSLWVCTAPLSHPETIKFASDVKSESVSSDKSSQIGQLLDAGTAQAIQAAGNEIESPIATVRKTAEVAAKTIGKSLGNYIRGKVQHQKNIEMLQRFDGALTESMMGLRLSPQERSKLIQSIERAYIEDAESGKYELDQLHFYDLPNLVKKEYSEIEIARTEEGTVDSFNDRGELKTRWTIREGKPHGPAVTYYSDGEIKFIDIYEDGRRISRKKYNRDGQLMFEQQYNYEAPVPAAAPAAAEIAAVQKTVPSNLPGPETSEENSDSSSEKSNIDSSGSDARIEMPFKEIQPINP
jgi:antitoxin component YwqK of YwqJK toxin-antitoxin module